MEKDFCKNWDKVELKLVRSHFDELELDVAALLNMTGVKISWNYSQNVIKPSPLFVKNNDRFIKAANLFSQYESEEDVWKEITEIKIDNVIGDGEGEKEEFSGKIYADFLKPFITLFVISGYRS